MFTRERIESYESIEVSGGSEEDHHHHHHRHGHHHHRHGHHHHHHGHHHHGGAGRDVHNVKKAMTLQDRKHVRVGWYMWRVRIKHGKVYVAKRNFFKWLVKSFGGLDADLAILGTINLKGPLFEWKWKDHEFENSEEAYELAQEEGGRFTRWFVLHAVAGKIKARRASMYNNTGWFRKHGGELKIEGDLSMPLDTLVKSGALMELVKKTSPTSRKTSKGTLIFAVRINKKYTTLTKVQGVYITNHGALGQKYFDTKVYEVRPVLEGWPKGQLK